MLLRPKSGARRTRLIAPRSHDQLSSEPHGVCRPSVHTSTSATRREGPHAGVDRACVSRWREKSAIVRRRHLSAAALVAVRQASLIARLAERRPEQVFLKRQPAPAASLPDPVRVCASAVRVASCQCAPSQHPVCGGPPPKDHAADEPVQDRHAEHRRPGLRRREHEPCERVAVCSWQGSDRVTQAAR